MRIGVYKVLESTRLSPIQPLFFTLHKPSNTALTQTHRNTTATMATATKKVNIGGVQGGRGPNNQTPARLELSTYLQDPDRKTLLLLGLERMQARPQSDPKSWYQVAGIHGEPYRPWDGEADSRGRKPGGYCTHSSVCTPLVPLKQVLNYIRFYS